MKRSASPAGHRMSSKRHGATSRLSRRCHLLNGDVYHLTPQSMLYVPDEGDTDRWDVLEYAKKDGSEAVAFFLPRRGEGVNANHPFERSEAGCRVRGDQPEHRRHDPDRGSYFAGTRSRIKFAGKRHIRDLGHHPLVSSVNWQDFLACYYS